MSLSGKRIVVGITGGIAAYKTIEFIRLLRKSNAEVRVALTPAAAEFVTPLTLQAISGNAVSQSCLLYTSPSPRDRSVSRMPSSA